MCVNTGCTSGCTGNCGCNCSSCCNNDCNNCCSTTTDPCADSTCGCNFELSAGCVRIDGNPLECLGVVKGQTLEQALIAIDAIVCNLSTAQDGVDGDSAYDIWLNLGNAGTEQDFIDSLAGAAGADGQGINNVTFTSSSLGGAAGQAGATDTYTVWGDAGMTINLGTFVVYNGTNGTNGADGQDIDHVSFTSSTGGGGAGVAGETDTYTVWGDVGETINLGTFVVYNGADGIDSYDSGWKVMNDYTALQGFGLAPYTTGWTHPKLRVSGRTVFLEGRVLIPLASDSLGAVLLTDADEYPSDHRVYTRTYEGVDGGFDTAALAAGAAVSTSPILPPNLAPTTIHYIGTYKMTTRAIRDKNDISALVYSTVFGFVYLGTDGKLTFTTLRDGDDSALVTGGGAPSGFTHTNPIHKLVTKVHADDYAPDFSSLYNGFTKTTSGTLTIGKTYTITNFIAGDDFTNVGGTNVTGATFIATGTTPTTWANLSEVAEHKEQVSISTKQYPVDFDGEDETQLGGFFIDITTSFPLDETLTEAQIIAAFGSI